jgi:hypothetical protein
MKTIYTYKKIKSSGPRPHIIYENGKARANFKCGKDAKTFLKLINK